MSGLAAIKRAGRRMVVSCPHINPLLRSVWRGLTLTRPKARRRFPVVGRFAVDLPGSGRLTLATRREDWLLTALFWYGFDAASALELRVFRAMARGSRTVLDIGANIGLYALAAARDNPIAEVHAFEPLPENAEVIRWLSRLNRTPNLQTQELALSDVEGTSSFYIPRDRLCNVRDASLVAGFRENVQEIRVRTTTLDAFATECGLRHVDVMKVDVESAEPMVFRGGAAVMERDRPLVFCEVLAEGPEEELYRITSPWQYRYFWIGPQGLVERPRPVGDPSGEYRNYAFLPVERCGVTLHEMARAGIGVTRLDDALAAQGRGAA